MSAWGVAPDRFIVFDDLHRRPTPATVHQDLLGRSAETSTARNGQEPGGRFAGAVIAALGMNRFIEPRTDEYLLTRRGGDLSIPSSPSIWPIASASGQYRRRSAVGFGHVVRIGDAITVLAGLFAFELVDDAINGFITDSLALRTGDVAGLR